MCQITIGSDTGGSTRIPAAFCGIVGFKPSKFRVPTEGAFALSQTLDSIGPMAASVADCALADAVMAGEEPKPLEPVPLAGLRIGVAQGMPMEALDETVGKRFPDAIARLSKAGAHLSDEQLPLLARMVEVNSKGGIVPPEGLAIHRDRLARRAADLDPNIRVRLERAAKIAAADYIDMLQARGELVRAMDARLADLDVLAMPTTPIVPPTIAEVAAPDVFSRKNAMVLRNTSIGNFFDLCAVSLPLPREGGLPTGLMLFARNGQDHRLLRVAATIERLLNA
jgi:aspartyl-tRNA(Asn)/glutamyl-tRNA(Gln) amidotransferase subunit A